MSKKIDLGPANPSNELLTYGGLFDICNGTALQAVDLVRLKTAALFYDRIIVEDGYFHCYGPIHTHFQHLLRSGGDPTEDELAQLIEAGIVVPALRTGESLHDNFVGSVRGIVPGKFLTLPNTDESRRTLRLVDDLVHHKRRGRYAIQPDSFKDQVVGNFGKLVGQSLYGDSSEISVVEYLDQDGLGGIHNNRKLELLRLAGEVREVANKAGFRRGAIENCIRERLGLGPTDHIYEELISHCQSGATTPGEIHVALYLLWVTSTAYELTHAAEFGTVGGLFSSHEPHLVTTGVFDHLNDIVRYDFRGLQGNAVFMGDVLDFGRLSVKDIVELRESEVVGLDTSLFEAYRGHFQRWLRGPQSDNDLDFESTHKTFIGFLQRNYIPAIAAKIARETNKDPRFIDRVFGHLAGLVTAVAAAPFIATIKIQQFPIASIVAAYSAGYLGAVATSRGKVLTEKLSGLIQARTVESRLNQYKAQRVVAAVTN